MEGLGAFLIEKGAEGEDKNLINNLEDYCDLKKICWKFLFEYCGAREFNFLEKFSKFTKK